MFAGRIADKLRIDRDKGRITPVNPMRGKQIAHDYNKKFGTKHDDISTRMAVHYARAVLRQPIGSNGDGYYWCMTLQEGDEVEARLMARVQEQISAAKGPRDYFTGKQQGTLFDYDGPKDNTEPSP